MRLERKVLQHEAAGGAQREDLGKYGYGYTAGPLPFGTFSGETRFRGLNLDLVGTLALTACGINSVPTKEEAAKAQWANVENALQRRSDLIPNLVATVKGYAAHEKETLEGVVNARAKATGVQVTPEVLNAWKSDPAVVFTHQPGGLAPRARVYGRIEQGELDGLRTAILGSGQAFPDVLAAGPLSYARNHPLAITRPGNADWSSTRCTIRSPRRRRLSSAAMVRAMPGSSSSRWPTCCPR